MQEGLDEEVVEARKKELLEKRDGGMRFALPKRPENPWLRDAILRAEIREEFERDKWKEKVATAWARALQDEKTEVRRAEMARERELEKRERDEIWARQQREREVERNY